MMVDIGHVNFLEKARALGTFLYVGIHDDPSTYNVLGGNFPIMNMHERVLNVLACKWVDEVIIGAPWYSRAPFHSPLPHHRIDGSSHGTNQIG
jgi:cytidyltransferase-like protein